MLIVTDNGNPAVNCYCTDGRELHSVGLHPFDGGGWSIYLGKFGGAHLVNSGEWNS